MYQKNEKSYKIHVIIVLLKKEGFNMNGAERILKEMNTPEGKEKIKKLLEEYFAKENAENIKIQEMLANTNYIKWLDSFTIEHSSFFDDDWLYFPEKISKEDLEQVNNLHLMYHGIERYASKNYIYPTNCDFGNFYKVKLENTGFEIGMLVGQGTLFFCNRVQIGNRKDFIDFNDILNNKGNDNITTIKKKLNELSNLVVSLYKSGVPLEAIAITLDNTLNKINFQNDLGQAKVLKRK